MEPPERPRVGHARRFAALVMTLPDRVPPPSRWLKSLGERGARWEPSSGLGSISGADRVGSRSGCGRCPAHTRAAACSRDRLGARARLETHEEATSWALKDTT